MKSLEVQLNEALEIVKAKDVTIAALKKTLAGLKEAEAKPKDKATKKLWKKTR